LAPAARLAAEMVVEDIPTIDLAAIASSAIAHTTKQGAKRWCEKEQIRKIVADLTPEQQVTFAILAVKQVYKEPNWNVWADNWLSGKDRSVDAAWRAAEATDTADAAAARAAARAAAAWYKATTDRWCVLRGAVVEAAAAAGLALEADPALNPEEIAKQAITHTTQTQGAKQ